jgi:hypothetical protein
VNFHLLYEGPLPANASPKEKHTIRRVIHPQLAELWRQPPLATLAEHRRALEADLRGPGDVPLRVRRGNFEFVPVVSTRLRLVCHLEVLFLRPGPPGILIGHGGDIDNRLKTLFDALQIPTQDQIAGEQPERGEIPFFCLLEDDALITRISVETDRLLKPEPGGVRPDPTRVALVLRVTLKATELTIANMELVS